MTLGKLLFVSSVFSFYLYYGDNSISLLSKGLASFIQVNVQEQHREQGQRQPSLKRQLYWKKVSHHPLVGFSDEQIPTALVHLSNLSLEKELPSKLNRNKWCGLFFLPSNHLGFSYELAIAVWFLLSKIIWMHQTNAFNVYWNLIKRT